MDLGKGRRELSGPLHYSLTAVGILLRVEGGPDKLGYLVKSW